MNETETKFLHIKPTKGLQFIRIKEIKEYKDLIYLMAVRDVKVKYSQTVLGGFWAILQPLVSMVVFSVILGKFGKIPSDGVAYPLFSFVGLVAWNYFMKAVTGSSGSLVYNRSLLSKVYFPRFIIPLTPVLSGLVDFAVAFATLVCMMGFFGVYPSISVALVPFLLLLMMVSAFGVGSLLSALNAKYRDINHVTVFVIQLWMFISPVVYPTSMVPEKYRSVFILNPLVGILEGFRWALLGKTPFPGQMLIVSTIASVILFIAGLLYFKRMERFFADII